jgi:hypothetical protein
MSEPRPVINLEDPVGKTVGKRRVPKDPLKIASGLNETALALMKASGVRLPRRGVYRFRSFEEADAWEAEWRALTKNH